jgi:hypothetical protein
MESFECCPQCSRHFEASTHREPVTAVRLLFMLMPTSAREVPGVVFFGVCCPFCGASFQSRTLRYFGWLSYRVYMALLFTLLVLLFLVASIVFLQK